MDAPIESLPAVARERLETIEKRIRSVPRDHGPIAKFWAGVAAPFAPWVLEKSMADAEAFVLEWFTRGDDWIVDATGILYAEAEVTAQAAIEAQLGSAFGKKLPAGFEFSAHQTSMMKSRALQSATSIAGTYNAKIPGWIKKVQDEWREKHGSLRGLNRWAIIKGVGRKHHAFQKWKEKQIAVTEFSNPWASATSEFWGANAGDLELEFYLAPDSASSPEIDSEPLCSSYCGQWLSREESQMFPAHVNCTHFVAETRIRSGQIPTALQIGDALYMTEDL